MFNKKNYNSRMNQGFIDPNMQRLIYDFEETTHKLKNLNNRLRRIENYLGLRNDDKYDEDIFQEP